MIKGIHHVAVCVTDFEQGLTFYSDLLGFEVVERIEWDSGYAMADQAIGLPDTAAKLAMLKAPNAYIELWQYLNPKPENRSQRPCDYGFAHLALQVEGIQEEYDRLSAGGMKFVGPVVDFGDIAAIYGKDPFGNTVELYEIRDGSRAEI